MEAPPPNADAYAVMAAIEAAANDGAGSKGAWVLDYLEDSDDWVLATAAAAVGDLGLREAIPTLIRLLGYGRRPLPKDLHSPMHAYAEAVVAMELVDVRLAALRSLTKLAEPGDGAVWEALAISAEHPHEHTSVRKAATEALAPTGPAATTVKE